MTPSSALESTLPDGYSDPSERSQVTWEAKVASIFSPTGGDTPSASHAVRLISSAIKKIDEVALVVIKTPCITQLSGCGYGLYILRGSLPQDYLNMRSHIGANVGSICMR